MSLHPTPSTLALNVGRSPFRHFWWDSIAEDRAPGIYVSDALPIDASHYLANQISDDNRLVVTDAPGRWPGSQHVSPDNIEEIDKHIRPVFERANRRSPAMIVFDVDSGKWTEDLAEFYLTMLRQGRSYGTYVLTLGPVDPFPEGHILNFSPMVLRHVPDTSFPALVVRYQEKSGEWMNQALTFELQPA